MLLAHLGHFQGETDMSLCHDRKPLEVFLAAPHPNNRFQLPRRHALSLWQVCYICQKLYRNTRCINDPLPPCKKLALSALKTKQFLGQIRPALPFSWSFSSSCVSAGLHFDAIDVNSPEDRGRCLLAPASLSISPLGDDAVNVHAKTLRVACAPRAVGQGAVVDLVPCDGPLVKQLFPARLLTPGWKAREK